MASQMALSITMVITLAVVVGTHSRGMEGQERWSEKPTKPTRARLIVGYRRKGEVCGLQDPTHSYCDFGLICKLNNRYPGTCIRENDAMVLVGRRSAPNAERIRIQDEQQRGGDYYYAVDPPPDPVKPKEGEACNHTIPCEEGLKCVTYSTGICVTRTAQDERNHMYRLAENMMGTDYTPLHLQGLDYY